MLRAKATGVPTSSDTAAANAMTALRGVRSIGEHSRPVATGVKGGPFLVNETRQEIRSPRRKGQRSGPSQSTVGHVRFAMGVVCAVLAPSCACRFAVRPRPRARPDRFDTDRE